MGEPEIEESVARDLGKKYHHLEEEKVGVVEKSDDALPKYNFGTDFQTKIVGLMLKDSVFNERTEGLVRPEFFENIAEAALVNISLRYFKKYKRTPDIITLMNIIKEDAANKVIRKDMLADVKSVLKRVKNIDISDRDYVIDEISTFARYQALQQAILTSVEYIERHDFAKVFDEVKSAMEVGASETLSQYDYWDRIGQRTQIRKDLASGEIKRTGISTGISTLNKQLYHHGWGRKELSVFMGKPKVGKSIALANFAKNASLLGFNVLFATLEVSSEITAERLDASLSDIAMKTLGVHILEVEDKIKLASKRAGALDIHEFPTGSMTPAMLRRLISRYKSQGKKYDLVVVDYADLMAPDFKTSDSIENSKSVYQGLRAIAQEEDLAMLTATQTNREGAKSSIAKMDHVAEDFNRIRIADIVISINRTDKEKEDDVARLHFVASRNQVGDYTITIQQDLEKMQFIKKILKRE